MENITTKFTILEPFCEYLRDVVYPNLTPFEMPGFDYKKTKSYNSKIWKSKPGLINNGEAKKEFRRLLFVVIETRSKHLVEVAQEKAVTGELTEYIGEKWKQWMVVFGNIYSTVLHIASIIVEEVVPGQIGMKFNNAKETFVNKLSELFVIHIFNPLQKRISYEISKLVAGINVDPSALKNVSNCIRLFEHCGRITRRADTDDPLRVYINVLETPYVKQKEDFFLEQYNLISMLSFEEVISQMVALTLEEVNICTRSLLPRTIPLIKETAAKTWVVLIKDQCENEFSNMLKSDNKKVIKNIFEAICFLCPTHDLFERNTKLHLLFEDFIVNVVRDTIVKNTQMAISTTDRQKTSSTSDVSASTAAAPKKAGLMKRRAKNTSAAPAEEATKKTSIEVKPAQTNQAPAQDSVAKQARIMRKHLIEEILKNYRKFYSVVENEFNHSPVMKRYFEFGFKRILGTKTISESLIPKTPGIDMEELRSKQSMLVPFALAEHLNQLIKESKDDIHRSLCEVVELFGCLSEKDRFLDAHYSFLEHRVMNSLTKDFKFDNDFVLLLQRESVDVPNILNLLSNVNFSKDILDKFRQTEEGMGTSKIYDALIIQKCDFKESGNVVPTLIPFDDFTLFQDSFTRYYCSNFGENRLLTFSYVNSKVDILFRMPGTRGVQLSTNIVQASILILFNTWTKIDIGTIHTKTGIPLNSCFDELDHLIKSNVLTVADKILESQSLVTVSTTPIKDTHLNLVRVIKVDHKQENEIRMERVEKLSVAIVRLMKEHKEMDFKTLETKVTAHVVRWFPPSRILIKEAVERLIGQEFIERKKDGKKETLIYKA